MPSLPSICPTSDLGGCGSHKGARGEAQEGMERVYHVILLSVKFHLDGQKQILLDSWGPGAASESEG